MKISHFHCLPLLLWLAIGLATNVQADVALKSRFYSLVAPDEKTAADRMRELEWSARVFETLLGVAPAPGRVVLSERPPGSVLLPGGRGAVLSNTYQITGDTVGPDGTRWSLAWYAKENFGNTHGSRQYSALTHEAAHLQLVHALNATASDTLKAQFNGYGAFVPDWIDEAVAVYHEPDRLKSLRRSQFRPDAHIPLRTFFTMSHPVSAKPRQVIVEARTLEEAKKKFAAIQAQQGTQLEQSAAELSRNAAEVNRFYTQALAVVEYMTARGGRPFFRYVVSEQNQAKTMDQILAAWPAKLIEITRQRAQIQGPAASQKRAPDAPLAPVNNIAGVLVRPGEIINPMPPTIDLFEADFVRWIKERYPRYRPELPSFPKKWFGE